MPEISILFPNRPSSKRAVIGCREDLSPAISPRIHRRRDGTPLVQKTSFPRKWVVSLSNSGSLVEIPFTDLKVGDPVVIDSSVWWKARIEANAMSIHLDREPAKILVQNTEWGQWYPADFGRHPDGKGWGVSAQFIRQFLWYFGALDVHYRPRLRCIITAISWAGSASDREQGWSLEAEEEHAWLA